jgi:drug/metabolite transporter (DMT)-like permease
MTEDQDRSLAAAGAILLYAAIIGFTDNFVRVIAVEAGLWQFHATRTALALLLLGLVALPLGLRLWPRNPRAVLARSAIHGVSMLIYFGALAFLPVAQVAAGLFTAPIFVLLIGRIAYGQPIGALQAIAVATGFAGVTLVLGPDVIGDASPAALLPVLAGALYALGNIATREWCAEESAGTLLAGFFAALGLLGLLGMALLAVLPLAVPEGAAGFVQRGAVWPSGTFLFWTFVQATGSVVAIGLMIRAYQLAPAGRVSVFEYAILPASAFWGWVLWDEHLTPLAVTGMILIAAAGLLILRGAERPAAAGAPAVRR